MDKRHTIITQLSDKQLDQLHCLYKEEWWSSKRTILDVKRIVKNSSLIFGLVDQSDSLIAFCRVLTDHCIFAYIYDFIVKSDCRNQGLGDMTLKAVLDHPKLKLLDSIELVCRKNMTGYYQKYGFSVDYGQSIPMQLKI